MRSFVGLFLIHNVLSSEKSIVYSCILFLIKYNELTLYSLGTDPIKVGTDYSSNTIKNMIEKKELQELGTSVVIENKIFIIRGQKVMLDSDLAEIYQVPTRVLTQSIKRNLERFPEDFMFQLSDNEYKSLRSQSVTSKVGRGGRRYLPYAFTEHGIAMLSSVLNSPHAIQMNIYIIRAFIKMREILAIDKNLELKLLQFKIELDKRGEDVDQILRILKNLLNEPIKPPGPLGFQIDG